MRTKQIGSADAFQLGLKNEAMMNNHTADLCQIMGDFKREQILRHRAKETMRLYWKLEMRRKKNLGKLITALEQPTLFE